MIQVLLQPVLAKLLDQRVILWAVTVGESSPSVPYGILLFENGSIDTVPINRITVLNPEALFKILDGSYWGA